MRVFLRLTFRVPVRAYRKNWYSGGWWLRVAGFFGFQVGGFGARSIGVWDLRGFEGGLEEMLRFSRS